MSSSSFPSGGDFKNELAREMAELQQDLNRAYARQAMWLGLHGPPPPLKGWKRVKSDVFWTVRGLRERVARRIAPWLDEY